MNSEDDFGTVAVYGVGLLGGSLGLALKRRHPGTRVVGIGRSEERLQKAIALGAIDSYTLNLSDGCRNANIVIACTPVAKIICDLPEILRASGPDTVVTDVGSVKSAIVAAAAGDPRFIGCHPMAGSEAGGVEWATENLFDGATWAITPVETTSHRSARVGRALGTAVGSVVRELEPDEHDKAVAIISHLPHVLATSLMHYASRQGALVPDLKAMSAGSFGDATRVAASSPEIWRDICMSNRVEVVDAIYGIIEELRQARRIIETATPDELESFFAAGAVAKKSWYEK